MHRLTWLLLSCALLALTRAKVQRLLLTSKTGPPRLDVKIGRSAALSSRHLPIYHKARNGDLCRVEVDDNDPTSLMVGRLEPRVRVRKVFSARLQQNASFLGSPE